MSVVERVARAIDVADGRDPDAPANIRYPGGYPEGVSWKKQIPRARAAIEAMREPTDEMELAGWGAIPSADATDIWQAMIDAALREGE